MSENPPLKGASFDRPAAHLLEEDEVEAMEALKKVKKKAEKPAEMKPGAY